MGLNIHVRNLFTGYLPEIEAAIYQTPNGRTTIIKSVALVNETAEERIVNLRVISSGKHARILPNNFILVENGMAHLSDSITLVAGERLFASCDQGTAVTCKINGVEEVV